MPLYAHLYLTSLSKTIYSKSSANVKFFFEGRFYTSPSGSRPLAMMARVRARKPPPGAMDETPCPGSPTMISTGQRPATNERPVRTGASISSCSAVHRPRFYPPGNPPAANQLLTVTWSSVPTSVINR